MLGIKQVMVRRFEPTQVFRLIQEDKATNMCVVPTMANALINAPDRAQWDLSSLRVMNVGGAASSPELVERVASVWSHFRLDAPRWAVCFRAPAPPTRKLAAS